MRTNPPSLTGSSTTRDQKNFINELKKVLDVMHVADVERVEIAANLLKYVSRNDFDQWKEGRDEIAPHPSWVCFDKSFLGHFFPHEFKEAKVREFLTLKKDSLSVYECEMKFTQLSRYAPEMVKDMRSRMSLFFWWIGLFFKQRGSGSNVYWLHGHFEDDDPCEEGRGVKAKGQRGVKEQKI